ncbi:RNA polymerase sigma-70 factor [Chitinophaga qingshengii]|uniref:RNA polymerase sigma-70 factor n=1 Tax=Chitinophaga qingshengii TaxID=1569794 RepID=A0ABR7TJ37_9BACT|nr:RNA polymerase sigma-70 factor [Chitinophaga qingshengii]MBC9930517.1 RNA polymerase sigma-70 factor [Chitinophaga qingshengii]
MDNTTNLISPKLLLRLHHGEEDALRSLLDMLGPKVLAYCKKKVGNEEDAEELLLDIFLKLWHFREKIDQTADIQVLLFTIARNHILNFIRRKATRQLATMEPSEALLHPEDVIRQRMDYKELHCQYLQVLDKLGEKQRTVFRMSREEGLSHREIADKLGISVRTVEAHIHSSLKVIRTELKDAYILIVLLLFC